ncbi:Methylisocitrate lyase [Gammaproteobacteria bacterium MOLA455]|nr:Methylisocitrate lyase [Gammaproteobacteria bacterium MOLA455]
MLQQSTHAHQQKLASHFLSLHQRDSAFIIPNPWDVGTTHLLAQMGFEALATTSAGCAFFAGKKDNTLGRERILANAKELVEATTLPVSADLENGFGDSPEAVADTIRQAIDVGLVGGSIEDIDALAEKPLYSIELAAERIRAAREAIDKSGIPFVLTARAENFLIGRPDIRDTIERLQAFQEAGADVLYAPGLTTEADIKAVTQSVDRPVNVVMGLAGANYSQAELSAMGVKRISVGSALARAALGAIIRAGNEMIEHGRFEFAEHAVKYADISEMLD